MEELERDCSKWQSEEPKGATQRSDHKVEVWLCLEASAVVEKRKAKLRSLG
jgi:hypothetical protein